MNTKAIVVYLDNKPVQVKWFNFLYNSWKSSGASDTWDLVVFTDRYYNRVPSDVHYVQVMPFSDRPGPCKNHVFANSIHCLTVEKAAFLGEYDILCRSDVDVFLSPSFRDFRPQHMHCGVGGYAGMQEVRDNIIRVAAELDLTHHGIHQMGSTYIGPTDQVLAVAGLQMRVTEHLLTHDFRTQEGQWPGWYGGVVTMYAGEIALNHICGQETMITSKIDARSDAHGPIKDVLTVHCWHTDSDFSKYRDYSYINSHLCDTDDVVGWCMYNSQLNYDV